MDNDRLAKLERRLALVEAFLDAELRKRQHLAQMNTPYDSGPINPWYGCSLGIEVHPINVGPIVPDGPLTGAEAVIGDVRSSVRVDE